MLDAVAADATGLGAVGVSCECLPCRFGNAADQPRRSATYPTDQTDAAWAQVRQLIPVPAWMVGRGGRPEGYCHRVIVDAILYVVDNGIKRDQMAGAAGRLSGVGRGLPVLPSLARPGSDRPAARPAAPRGPRRRRPRARTLRCGHRFPVAARRRDCRHRAAWLRRRVEDQRHEAAYRRRHARSAADRAGHRRLGVRPRRRTAAAAPHADAVPARATRVGRRRLRRRADRLGRTTPAPTHRSRTPHRITSRVRRPAPPLGRGADLGLAHPQTPPGARLRTAGTHPRDDGALGDDPAHGTPTDETEQTANARSPNT